MTFSAINNTILFKNDQIGKDNPMSTSHIYTPAAAYIRVSDERQDEYSPDSQLKKIREYAARDGYYIPYEYVF